MADELVMRSLSLADADADQSSGEARVYQLLRRLCLTACPPLPTKTVPYEIKQQQQQQQQLAEFIFSHCLQQLMMGSRLPRTLGDEGAVVRRIHKNLIQQKRDSVTALFSERVSKLEKIVKSSEMRCSMLTFLLRLMDVGNSYHNSTLLPGIPPSLTSHKLGMPSDLNLSSVTSGISMGFDSTVSTTKQHVSSHSMTYRGEDSRSFEANNHSRPVPKRRDALSCYGAPFSHLEHGPSWRITEQDLVRDLIFIFQGASGTHLQFDNNRQSYYFAEETRIPTPVHGACMKLAELGKLYQKLNDFASDNQKEAQKYKRNTELLVVAFKTALKDHLFEYYRFISILDEKLHREVANPEEAPLLSLRRLMVWAYEPLQCFQMLWIVVEQCQSLSGCKLMNRIYEFSRTGHPDHAVLLNSILGKLFSPFKTVLDKWLYEGDLPSKHTNSQFFIKENLVENEEDVWDNKYVLLKEQVPSFISHDLALKVLVTGKSISFLKEKCKEHKLDLLFNLVEVLKRAEDETFDSLIDGRVETRIRDAYAQTCKYLMDVLKETFYFHDHMKAMRRYLLLGQGDFIRMLMDLLYNDLEREGKFILKHNLITLMGDAIRATNARFDKAYILDRLDITLFDATEGEKGWDIFSLFYHFKRDGPLICIFSRKVMINYLKIFNFIWRAQRTEFILSKAWKSLQGSGTMLFENLGVSGLVHMSHTLISAMIHFSRQMHYFLSFEVLACGWEELQTHMEKAADFDQLREAHLSFLNSISTSCFLKNSSITEEEHTMDNELSVLHRGISDEIVKYISKLNDMYARCDAERSRRQIYAQKAGLPDWRRIPADEECAKFRRIVDEKISPDLRISYNALMGFLWKFVRGLKNHRNTKMKLFGYRLDFNGFFLRFKPED